MNNKMTTNEQISRMKALMGYGLQTESKAPYSSVENQKLGADGKMYGIVREGTKYYIKSAPNKSNLVKEDFNYIGGFRNRKDYQYDSFADAQKNFDMKMMSIREAANRKDFNVESWDLNKKETVVVEATDKMKKEILRERQIMSNAKKIFEAKKECANGICDTDIKNSQKNNISSEVEECGDAATANAGYTNASVPKGSGMAESVVKEEEVLGWNRNSPDYMDKSHGTEIGDSAPFDDKEARNIDDGDKKVSQTGEMKNGVVENHGTSMHDTDDQNKPAVGVGEGPSDDNNKPFDDKKGKQIDEAIDDFGPDDAEGGADPMGGGDDLGAEGGDDLASGDDLGAEGGDDLGAEGDDEFGDEGLGDDLADGDVEGEDMYEDDVESRLDAMEDLLSQIADKLGISAPAVDDEAYGDDDLFDDEEGDDFGGEDDFGAEGGDDFGGEDDFEGGDDFAGGEGDFEGGDDFEDEDEMPMESRRRRGVQIYETKAFRRAMRNQRINEDGMTPFKDAGRVPSGNMNKLDDFGKHPAYQKKVMELPPKDLQEFPGYYDMNDDSVRNDNPYGEKIGDGAPFDIDPQSIDNAIAEAFDRLKKNRR